MSLSREFVVVVVGRLFRIVLCGLLLYISVAGPKIVCFATQNVQCVVGIYLMCSSILAIKWSNMKIYKNCYRQMSSFKAQMH